MRSGATSDTTLLVGSVDGDPATTLYTPRQPSYAEGDSVTVVNGLFEIRIYSRAGDLGRTVGRAGQGIRGMGSTLGSATRLDSGSWIP